MADSGGQGPRPDSDVCTVLVMVGVRDVITPPANSRALAGLLPNSTLLQVPGAGHSVLFQAPLPSAATISAFLDDVALPSTAWPCAATFSQ